MEVIVTFNEKYEEEFESYLGEKLSDMMNDTSKINHSETIEANMIISNRRCGISTSFKYT